MNSLYSFVAWTKSRFFESQTTTSEETAPGLINILPEDLVLEIFENSKTSLPALASVNKFWKNITIKDQFYNRMFSADFAALAFGKVDLKTHFGIDIGPEIIPRLSLKDYGDVKEERCLLTYFPEKIAIVNDTGAVSWVLPRSKYIGELVKKPKMGNASSFHQNSWMEAINQEREIKGGEWIITYKKLIGYGKAFEDQVVDAKMQGDGRDVAEFDKTIYAVFMHYVKTGERCFSNENAQNDFFDFSPLHFKEKIACCRVTLSYGLSGLEVDGYEAPDFGRVAVARVRKSIGN